MEQKLITMLVYNIKRLILKYLKEYIKELLFTLAYNQEDYVSIDMIL